LELTLTSRLALFETAAFPSIFLAVSGELTTGF